MKQKVLLFVLLMAVIAPAASAAPEGFRFSKPLTDRAVKVGGNKIVTVHCAKTTAIWRTTADGELTQEALGRADMRTREIQLPPVTCGPLEKWLKGRKVDTAVFATALFTVGHELGHAAAGIRDELKADCYATRRFNVVARAFGVKSVKRLAELRDEADLIPLQFC